MVGVVLYCSTAVVAVVYKKSEVENADLSPSAKVCSAYWWKQQQRKQQSSTVWNCIHTYDAPLRTGRVTLAFVDTGWEVTSYLHERTSPHSTTIMSGRTAGDSRITEYRIRQCLPSPRPRAFKIRRVYFCLVFWCWRPLRCGSRAFFCFVRTFLDLVTWFQCSNRFLSSATAISHEHYIECCVTKTCDTNLVIPLVDGFELIN